MPPDATAAPHRPMGPGAGGYTLGIRCLRHSEQGKAAVESCSLSQDVHNLPEFSGLLQDVQYLLGSAPLPGLCCCLYSSLWLLLFLPLLCWHPPAGGRPADA